MAYPILKVPPMKNTLLSLKKPVRFLEESSRTTVLEELV